MQTKTIQSVATARTVKYTGHISKVINMDVHNGFNTTSELEMSPKSCLNDASRVAKIRAACVSDRR